MNRLISHHEYDSEIHDYDFGLIELVENLAYTKNIQPISLPSVNDRIDGSFGVVFSWGENLFNLFVSKKISAFVSLSGMTKRNTCTDLYHKSIVPIVDHDNCSEIYESIHRITPRMVCAGKNADVKVTCSDDSGSPLIWRDLKSGVLKLVGLVSWSNGCGEPNYPGVYAFVKSARWWILENIDS